MFGPTVQGEGEVVRCQRCGAVVPLVSGAGTRCLYCLAQCEMPTTIAAPLQRDAALGREIQAQLELAAGQARTLRWGFVLGWGVLGLPPLLYFLGVLAYTVNEAMASRDAATRFLVIAVSFETLVFLAVFVGANLWLGARAMVRRTATRPFACAVIGGGTLRATCPACGGAVQPLPDGLLAGC